MFRNCVESSAWQLEPAGAAPAAASLATEGISKSTVAIRPILMNAYRDWRDEARRKGLSFRVVSPDVTVSTNAYWLGVIASRLIGNAVERTCTGDVSADFSRSGGRWIFTVQDSGLDISDSILSKGGEISRKAQVNAREGGLDMIKHAAGLLGHPLAILNSDLGSIVRLQIW